MPTWETALVVFVAIAFGVLVVWRYRPISASESRAPLSPAVRAARDRAARATFPRERSSALLEAATLAAASSHHTAALGLFARAARVDPAWPAPLSDAARLLGTRYPGGVEAFLLRRLATLEWTGETAASARAAAEGLATLYAGPLRDRQRASMARKLVALLAR